MVTTATTGLGVELNPVDRDVDSASEIKRRQQEYDMAFELALDASEKHLKPVTFLKEAGFLTATNGEAVDSLIHPTLAYQKLSRSNSGWRLEAGTLLVYDISAHFLRSPWLLERCWLWHEEREVLLDVTTPGWEPELKREGIWLPIDALEADRQTRGDRNLVPHLSHLGGYLGTEEYSLMYLPGIEVWEAVNHLVVTPDYQERRQMWSHLFGGDWQRLTKETREKGCCAALAQAVVR